MGLFVGNTPVKAVYVGSTPVKAVYVGSTLVWQDREVVQITLGTGNQARDQFRVALTDRGLNYRTVTEIPFDIKLVGAGSTQGMFDSCSSLTHVPKMDTSSVTRMDGMFYGCSSLTHVPDMDTSQVTSMEAMFIDCLSLTDGNVRLIGRHPNVNTVGMITGSGLTRLPFYDIVKITLGAGLQARDQFRAALTARGLDYRTVTEVPFEIDLVGTGSVGDMFRGCSALVSVPDLDTSQVTRTANMFYGCSSLVSVPDLETSQVTSVFNMFYGCSSLTSVPEMDTSQATSMAGMFMNCSSLVSVPDLDASQATNVTSMFRACSALTDGNVRLIGKHPNADTRWMIDDSGLTREPFYDSAGNPI